MKNDTESIELEIDRIAAKVREKFGGLSTDQLSWKPDVHSWSIAQCLDHLIQTSAVYSVDFKAIADGTRRQSLWEKLSPLSGLFGRMLTGAMDKDEKKVKTSARFVPPHIINGNIIEKFTASQNELKFVIRGTADADWQNTILSSFFINFVTYSLEDAYLILIAHQHRHIRQAERLMEINGFPGKPTC